MSVIAARVNKDEILIAADSIILKEEIKRTNFNKLLKLNGMIIGGCGSASELCLMFDYAADNCPNAARTHEVIEFMRGFAEYKEAITGSRDIENEYILAYKGRLYAIERFFVQCVEDYIAIGQGEPFALTALHLGHDPDVAVMCACELCSDVAPPIVNLSMTRSEVD